jgi:hypothetical protein
VKLLTIGNTKTVKGESLGYMTFILHLAPSTLSGYNTCPMASVGCAAACLNTAGRGQFTRTQAARIRKTRWFFNDRVSFMHRLVKDIEAAVRKATRKNMVPVFRLNGTSDIRWETVPVNGFRNIMDMFPTTTFYDYTKIVNRRNLPTNYYLTFSRSESNGAHVLTALRRGMNVAVVFEKTLPDIYMGYRVIDGTETDLRFLDGKGVIVGLVAKAKAKRDTTGFTVRQSLAA